MLIRILSFRPRRLRVPIVLFWSACAVTLTTFHLKHWIWAELVLYLPFLILLEGVASKPGIVAFLTARDRLATLLAAAAAALAGGTLLIVGYGHHEIPTAVEALESQIVQSHALFVGVGFIIGLTLRHAIARLTRLALVGRERVAQNCLAISTWCAAILFFPLGPHATSAPWYLLSASTGILIHKGMRLRVGLRVGAWRRLAEVTGAFPPGVDARKPEIQALELLAAGRQFPSMRFKKLRSFLDAYKEKHPLTKRLALISACAYRLEGKYLEAIAETKPAATPPEDPVDAHLLVVRTLTLEELGQDEEVTSILKTLQDAESGRDCPLTNAIRARRAAELVLDPELRSAPSSEPLKILLHSLAMRRRTFVARQKSSDETIDLFLGRFMEVGVPVAPSLVLDITGYCFLAAGHVEEARVLLHRAISLDPDFSYPYLHLGDLFLFRRFLASGDNRADHSDIWHAKACYCAAARIERNSGSRVRRLAHERLASIAKRAPVAENS